MAHNHEHQHSHAIESLNKAFIIGIVLNLSFVLIEFGAGFYYDSLGLLSDAGHNLGDVASLFLALLAFRLARVKASPKYTYGYKKSTVLVSLLNAVILLIAVGAILIESLEKIKNPRPVEGSAIAWVAGIGVFINAFTAMLFMKKKRKRSECKRSLPAHGCRCVGFCRGISIGNHYFWYRMVHYRPYHWYNCGHCDTNFYMEPASRKCSSFIGWRSC